MLPDVGKVHLGAAPILSIFPSTVLRFRSPESKQRDISMINQCEELMVRTPGILKQAGEPLFERLDGRGRFIVLVVAAWKRLNTARFGGL